MKKTRFLRVLIISLILCFGIMFCIQTTSHAYFGLPYTQEISAVQINPFMSSSLNASLYSDLFSTYGTRATSLTNPFATYGSNAMFYNDPLSTASAQTMSYANIFGESFQTGQGFYRDPFYSTGGQYVNYANPAGGFSVDQAYAASPFGGGTHVSSELILPWAYYGTSIDTSYGSGVAATFLGPMPTASYGVGVQHAAFGTPTAFNMLGVNPDVAGQLALVAFAPYTASMDRALSNTYMYTKEGMPFIPVASYFNPDSYGGSNYFFPSGAGTYQAGTETVGGVPVGGYEVVSEISGGSVIPVPATAFGIRGLAGDVTGSAGVAVSPYGGWGGVPAGGGGVPGGGFVSGTGTTYGGGPW
jgi:hypothetical protein